MKVELLKNAKEYILRSILSLPFAYFKLDSTKRTLTNKSQLQSTRDHILNGYWM